MTTSFGGDSQPDPSIEDAGYGLGELPVEPTIVDRLGGLASPVNIAANTATSTAGTVGAVATDGSAVGIDDPGSWRPSDWPAASEQHLIEPNALGRQSQQTGTQQPAVPAMPLLDQQQQPDRSGHQPSQFGQQPVHHSQPLPVLGEPLDQHSQPSQQAQQSQRGYQSNGYQPPDYPTHGQVAHQGQRAERSQWFPPVQPAGAGGAGNYPPVQFADSLPYDPSDDFGDEASRVRPYAWTGGRTRSSVDLQLETLVSTSDLGQDEVALTQVEYRAVGTLCRHPHSVAEVAAKLSVPLGVAKVILSDMAELGLISIHRTFADDDIAAHLVLMERVLSGLRRL